MCGILGSVGGAVARTAFDAAVDRLRHRGPDDRGVECLPSRRGAVWLGFRRLAILDLSPRGHQPMFDDRRELCIVFNGEIYNFRELRAELEGKGHRFRTETDTEVILSAYRQWGLAAVERFVGMFAFALWDARSEELVLVRDRLGIKPLYLWEAPGRVVFASEPKAMFAIGVPRRLNERAVGKYLTFLWVPDPETLYEGIRQLEPGQAAVYRDGRLELRRYWDVPVDGRPVMSDERQARAALFEALSDAVRLRLISDVPLGAFLSGGVDSSLILALMQQVGARSPIITQTISYSRDDLRYDIAPEDAPYARQVRDSLGGLDYHEIVLQPDIVDLLPRVVWHLDDPVADPAAISTYLICRAARERATVMLSGMGAEELFGGYPRHRAAVLGEYFWRLPPPVRHLIRQGIVERLPASRPGPVMRLARNAKKFVRSADLPFEDRYLGFLSYYAPEQLLTVLAAPSTDADVYERHQFVLDQVDGDFVRRMTFLDLKTFLPNLNLAYTDKASMAASVEVRVPIIDHRVVELVRRFATPLLVRGRRQKYVLKRVAERYLPPAVVWRAKTGFGAPIRSWVTKELRPLIHELLSEERLKRRGVFRPEAVWRIIGDQWAGREDNALRIWALLTFEVWAQTFLDGDGAAPTG